MTTHEVITTQNIAERATRGTWKMPEIQRDLKWEAKQSVLLLDSLARDISIRQVSLWGTTPTEKVNVRSHSGNSVSAGSTLLIIDGQQRSTALALLLTDQIPDWCDPADKRVRSIRECTAYNVVTGEFAKKKVTVKRHDLWIKAQDLFVNSEEKLEELIAGKLPKGATVVDVKTASYRANSLATAIRGRQVSCEASEMTLLEAAVAFERHNDGGVSLSQEAILRAAIGGHCPGLPGNHITPFVRANKGTLKAEDLEKAVIRSLLTDLAHRSGMELTSRLATIPLGCFDETDWQSSWNKVKDAWTRVLGYLERHGVSKSVLPGMNPVIPLVLFALRSDGPSMFGDDRMLALYLLGVRTDRFAKHSTDAHMMDADTILRASSGEHALCAMRDKLLGSYSDDFGRTPHFTAGELFAVPITSKANALFYASWAKRRNARDWKTLAPVSFSKRLSSSASTAIDSQWHHVVPLAYAKNNLNASIAKRVRGAKPGEHQFFDSVANIALIEAGTNLSLSDKCPSAALASVADDLLEEQLYVSAKSVVTLEEAKAAIAERAQMLAAPTEMNWFITLLESLAEPSADDVAAAVEVSAVIAGADKAVSRAVAISDLLAAGEDDADDYDIENMIASLA